MRSRCQTLISCTMCYGLAFLFAWLGLAKLAAPAAAQRSFIAWGFPDWFHLLVGSLELLGAILIVFGATTTLASALLGGIMLGAVATHLDHGEFGRAVFPALLLVPIACVGFCRRLDAAWMRRLSRRAGDGHPAPSFDPRHTLAGFDDDSIVPGMPELRLTRHADVPDASGSAHQRSA